MNTYQIEKILKTNMLTRKYFLGVFSRDELPFIYKYPCCFILNTDPSNKPGEHWLAIYYDENQNAEFFDPAGYDPSRYRLLTYLDKTSKSWKFNNQRLQGFFSELCGQYCILYLITRCGNYSLKTFINMFTTDYDKNDDIIRKKFKNI